MVFTENKSSLTFKDIDINSFSNSFVPYLYLDGHRSSSAGSTDLEKYSSGFRFFLRFGLIMQNLGLKEMVTMVHTSRNCCLKERLDSIISAIQENFDASNSYLKNSKFKLYGELETYKEMGYTEFFNFITQIINNNHKDYSFTHHILINYSENWALNNLDKIKLMPDISSIIRFTKGFASGGWIPLKMQETTFIYSQIPSVSEYWSDEAIEALIYISLQNWSLMKQYIGKKVYMNSEKELIHTERDINLKFSTTKLEVNSSMHNRIIAFGVNGPIIYEL
ncbi:MAG: hypothetical protein ACM339_10515 [Ignavibacteria bacterium]